MHRAGKLHHTRKRWQCARDFAVGAGLGAAQPIVRDRLEFVHGGEGRVVRTYWLQKRVVRFPTPPASDAPVQPRPGEHGGGHGTRNHPKADGQGPPPSWTWCALGPETMRAGLQWNPGFRTGPGCGTSTRAVACSCNEPVLTCTRRSGTRRCKEGVRPPRDDHTEGSYGTCHVKLGPRACKR